MMMDNTIQITLPNTLDEDDYVIFNIQGQGGFPDHNQKYGRPYSK